MSVSRRQFVTTLGVGTAAWWSTRAADPVLRAAVIGHTGRGNYGHGLEQIFQGRPGIEVVGLADPDEAGRTRAAEALGVQHTYADWRELLDKERPQLVSVAMRHADQHAEIVLACVKAGAHVYVEKPFVQSPAEADAILLEAERRERRIAVAHTMRMMPVVQRFQQVLKEGLIGEVVALRAFGKQDDRAGGEDLMVLGTHLFDLMRMTVGDPLWCSARVLVGERDITAADRRLVKDNVGWVAGDRVWATFAFAHGVTATFASDARLRETNGHWGIEFLGSRGVARFNGDLSPTVFVRTIQPWSAEGRVEEWKPLEAEPVRAAPEHNLGPVSDWLAAIQEGREPECSGRNGAWAVEMVAAVYQSALSGGRVAFPLRDRQHPLGA